MRHRCKPIGGSNPSLSLRQSTALAGFGWQAALLDGAKGVFRSPTGARGGCRPCIAFLELKNAGIYAPLTAEVCCLATPLRLQAGLQRKGQAMAHNFAINDDVHHQLQGPQGRAVAKQRSVYTIVTCLPIEADGRPRYRIKSKTENVERVVTEEQISRLY